MHKEIAVFLQHYLHITKRVGRRIQCLHLKRMKRVSLTQHTELVSTPTHPAHTKSGQQTSGLEQTIERDSYI